VAIDPVREDPEERAFDYHRTVALSDGVFAIALTLLVLNISFPELAPGHTGSLGSDLLDRKSEIGSYALSFAVIGMLWVRHHSFFRGIDRIDTTVVVLNLVYLGLVAFLPYPTRVLGRYGGEPAAVVLYASNIALIGLCAGVMREHARRAGLLTTAGLRRMEGREHWGVVPALFLLSIPLAFLDTTLATFTWLLILFIPRVARRRASRS